jgi:SAM-dependent methyltransferase
MPIIRTTTHAEHYRLRAVTAKEIGFLSGRGPDREKTERVARFILSKVGITPGRVVVDVGCGDGTFLGLCSDTEKAGVLPTEEEANRVRSEHANLKILFGLVQHRLPLDDSIADYTVCNGVLLLLADVGEARQAMLELARITKPAGIVYLGEIPEAASRGIDHSSPARWLHSQLKYQGIRGFAAGVKDILVAASSKKELVFHPEPGFFAEPATIIEIALAHGLRCEWHQRHPFASDRWDFLFRKTA